MRALSKHFLNSDRHRAPSSSLEACLFAVSRLFQQSWITKIMTICMIEFITVDSLLRNGLRLLGAAKGSSQAFQTNLVIICPNKYYMLVADKSKQVAVDHTVLFIWKRIFFTEEKHNQPTKQTNKMENKINSTGKWFKDQEDTIQTWYICFEDNCCCWFEVSNLRKEPFRRNYEGGECHEWKEKNEGKRYLKKFSQKRERKNGNI